jgi:hypothetical protein
MQAAWQYGILKIAQFEIQAGGITTTAAGSNWCLQVFHIAGSAEDSVIVRIAP